MTRVPTYMTYVNMVNQTLNNKATFELYNFQTITGLKAPTYAGYGKTAYNIVSLEASLNVTQNMLNNNNILEVENNLINLSLQSTYDSVSDFKSMLLNFTSTDLSEVTPDYTGGKIVFGSDVVSDYVGKTITVDGTQYTFANDGTGNNIDISTAATGEDVMNALHTKLGTDPDYTFDGRTFTFPLYTINGTSSVLNVSGVTTGEPHTMNQDQYQAMLELQSMAFSTMVNLVENLNINTNGKYLFGGGNSYETPVTFPFKSLEEFQKYYDGNNIKYPSSSSADLSNRKVTSDATGGLTINLTGGNTAEIVADNAGGFLKEAIKANPSTTGDLTFNQDKNTIKATEAGAFNTLKAGDTMVIKGTNGANDKAYVIKEISADGRTITVDESTPVAASETITPNNDVTFSTTFPVSSVINLNGFGNNVAPQAQVTGVSDDGTKLYVTLNPDYFNSDSVSIPASSQWSMECDSYYRGGDLTYEKRISDNQTLVYDVNGNDPVFEKLFRALGEIAQGNLVDLRNPKDELDSLIDPNIALQRTQDALTLVYEALFQPSSSANVKNNDLYTVMAKMGSNYTVLYNTIDAQTLMQTTISSDITALKNVDQTEAAAKALIAKTNLEASYSALQQALSLSLLNYLPK